jgi:cell fate regulator YaaT (PSP1 superfamily)
MTETPGARPKLIKGRKYLLVRYGRMNNLGLFEHNESQLPKVPARVVVKTDKGLELGYVVGQPSTYKEGRFKLTEEQICGYFAGSEINFPSEPAGKVLRLATPDDISEEQHLMKITADEIACCERIASELSLRMRIVDAEHIFGGERIVFYFMAEGRVDFRELVRKLAQEYQTRIEMRQIGSRDEAKLLGDVESCGQVCCCIRFLQLLKPVNMRMAKMQKATLDPSKISGYCGRLKCCLRYEDQTYTDLKRNLPRKNTWVKMKKGEGKVIDGQILTQLVVVEQENGERVVVPLDEITIVPYPPARKRQPEEGAPSPAPSPAPRPPAEPKVDNGPKDEEKNEEREEERHEQPVDTDERNGADAQESEEDYEPPEE